MAAGVGLLMLGRQSLGLGPLLLQAGLRVARLLLLCGGIAEIEIQVLARHRWGGG